MGSALAGKRAHGGAVFVFSSGVARCRSRCVALLRYRDARERKGERNEARVLGLPAATPGFVRAKRPGDRRMSADGGDEAGHSAAQAGERVVALCRPRPTLRPGWLRARVPSWAGPF